MRWRVLMLLVLLGSIAIPLRRALQQVASETLARGAVQQELKRLVPRDALVSQEVSIGNGEIIIRLISTRSIPELKLEKVRQDLIQRTGRHVHLSVDAVASKSELADLMEHLAHPAPIIPREKTIAETQQELLDRVRPAIEASWPSSDAPIQDLNVVLGGAPIAIDVHYGGTKDLGEVPLNTVLQSLRDTLGSRISL